MRKSKSKASENETSDKEDDQPLVKPSSDKEDEEYEVDKIINVRNKRGKKEYLVRWKGFSEDSDTWESEDKLNCPDIVAKFEESAEKPSKKKAPAKKNKTKGKQKKEGNLNNSRKKRKRDESHSDENQTENDSDDEPKQKGKANKKSKSSDEEDDTEYEVERILEVHHKKNGKREFLVHWKGFSKSSDTWEPESHLNCPILIEKFLKKVSNAKEATPRETRVNRNPTDRYVLNAPDSGRKLSGRNRGPRRTYYDNE